MDKFKATLTGENFMLFETKTLGELIFQGKTEAEVRKLNKEQNLIKHKKIGSLMRVSTPIFRRLRIMNHELLDLFLHDDLDSSKHILLYTIMKTDALFYDFMEKVYYEKVMMRDSYITQAEVDAWYEEKLYVSENLQKCSDNTSYKIKQVILRIMQDSGLLEKENNNDKFDIIRPIISSKVINELDKIGDGDYVKIMGGLKR